MDTQQLRMESSLEMSVVTGTITAVITGLTPLKSKPVQAIIMSMSWLVQLDAIQHTVQVIHMRHLYTFISFVFLFNHYSSKLSDVNSINTSSTAIMAVMFLTGNVTHFVSIGLFSDLLNVMICTTRCEWTCVTKLKAEVESPGVKE